MTTELLESPREPRTAARRLSIVTLTGTEDGGDPIRAFADAVRAGLTATPRTLPWSYFYDQEGSRLFEEICGLPEYYLTRAEDSLIRRYADEMVESLSSGAANGQEPTIVELGSGSAVKTQTLIAAALRRHGRVHYVPIDVSATALEDSARRLLQRFPTLRVTGYVADYRRDLEEILVRAGGPRLVLFLGSSLGNYEPDDASLLLERVARALQPADCLLLGTDMEKDRSVLEAAYNDSAGVTAAFNRNILRRINRELGGDFRPENFRHRAVFDRYRGRVEMHLVSRCNQEVTIPAAGVRTWFAAEESIHTENSHKYQPSTLIRLRSRAGLHEGAAWTDSRGWFRLQRWQRGES
ncbi:MAG: L-histidine N(alpha)-methyltransferase [Isosphaeraceae bacterium]